MKRLTFALALCLTALSLVACGFHLRGQIQVPEALSPLGVRQENAPALAEEVRQSLQEQGIALAGASTSSATGQPPKLLVFLRNERLDRRVLSVSALSGKQDETELSQRVELEIRKADGTVLLEPQVLRLERDLTFDETAVLAKANEEEVVREELQRDLVAEVLRRIRAVAGHAP